MTRQNKHLVISVVVFLLALAVVGYIDGTKNQVESQYCESNPSDWTFCNYR